MAGDLNTSVSEICAAYGCNPSALLDIALRIQERHRHISEDAIDRVAAELKIPRVQVSSLVSFYSFFSKSPKGQMVIGVGDDIVDEIKGGGAVKDALTRELRMGEGETTPDGLFSLETIPYIGVPDQAPAIMVNETIVTDLRPEAIADLVRQLCSHRDPQKLVTTAGDGNNAHELVRSMIRNNIRKAGPVVLAEAERGAALRKAASMSADDMIMEIKKARIRGRGGAGFPAGMKWDFARHSGQDGRRYVACNADEGEPGTFKDRVLLTERPDLIFDGMTICAYGIKAHEGILYLRAEYAYLRKFLDQVLARRRSEGLLGQNICGSKGFDFDIRIQLGAGAYICGEETSLINSCEGDRGDPKIRPPFPVQKGYLGLPTVVNNPETFCCAARVIENGAKWFTSFGSQNTPGTKLLSICGDCGNPGVFEVPFGIPLHEALSLASAEEPQAVVVGGPSGSIVGPGDLQRVIDYDDLSTGGSIIAFNRSRDLLRVVEKFTDFFVHESCGHCTPCRVGNYLLRKRLQVIRDGKGSEEDLDYLFQLGESIKFASRCGLGQTSPNPIVSTLKDFRPIYEDRLRTPTPGRKQSFDLYQSIAVSEEIAGRKSTYFPH